MKRTSIKAAAAFILFFNLEACKKSDPVVAPVFKAAGYWEGTLLSNNLIGLLNKPDGTCRFYLFTTASVDTAAQMKFDGTYTVTGNTYYGNFTDTSATTFITLQTLQITSNSMSGIFFDGNHTPDVDQRAAADFSLVRR